MGAKNNLVVESLVLLSCLISFTSGILIPVYYFQFLPLEVYPYIFLSLISLLIFITITFLVYFKRKSLNASVKKIDELKIYLKDEVSHSLGEASNAEIIKKFKKINNLINLNKPVEALKLARIVLLQLLEYIKSSSLKQFLTSKYNSPISLLELIKIWENKINSALEHDEITLKLTENYFLSVFYIYEFLKNKAEHSPTVKHIETNR